MSNSLNHANSQSGAAPSPQLAAPESDEIVIVTLRKRFDAVKRVAESDTHLVYTARDLSHPAVFPGGDGGIRLKVLRTSLAGDSRQVELFRLEASAAARLSHANILKATEAENLNGIHFSVMEERPGVITLREHLEHRGWSNIEEAVQISQQIAEALQYAHGQGVLHLTLDPDKVLLDHAGTAYVTGFGIDRAKDLLWARQERARHCAARYITPEQILSGDVDQRTDLYLLGLIFYEMLTDRAPFESEDRADLRFKHLSRTPAPPHTFRPEISRDLSQTVMDLLSKRSDGRPFDIGAFKSTLERCIVAGLIVREQDEEADSSALLHESDASFEGSGSPAPLATPDEEEQKFEPDEIATTEGAAAAADEVVEDTDYFYQPDSTDVGYVNEFQEPDDGFDGGSQTYRDAIEIPLRNTREYEQGESMETEPALLLEEPGRVKSSRLVWPVILLLIGGGLFWAILAARSQGESDAKVSGEVTNLRSNDEPSASNAEVSARKAEPVTSGTAEELPSDTDLANRLAEDALTKTKKNGPVATDQTKPTDKIEAEELSPPKRAEIAPPVVSTSVPVSTPEIDSPAEIKEVASASVQPRETAPPPQQPASTPAPKTIRKSGDVLQNTAIIRATPLYPKAARASKVKGAVTVEVTIDEEGSVIAARPISGPEQLRDAALVAARRWKWVPERVDRNRARVVGTITLNFKD
jgi:TonB family protein